MYLWCALAALRIAVVFLPQTGYVHPDEFFQSTEIAAGDIFQLQTYRTWEFTEARPIRSAAVIYLTTGLPLLALRWVLGRPPSPYLLLVVPRLFICSLSFLCDYAVYRACIASGRRVKDGRRCLRLLASSYVAIVYYGRTFSNTVESCLVALLFVTAVTNRTKGEKSLNTFFISGIMTVGIFNRPTFIIFAFPTVVYWLFHRISGRNIALLLRRAFLLSRTSLFLAATFVSIDTFYYAPESLAEVTNSVANFALPTADLRTVVSPLNFVRYNLDGSNLESHGVHPRWLHLVVNVPILFNVAGVVALRTSARVLTAASRGRDPVDVVCAWTVSFSIAFFSLFRHQEPRFLLPLLVPVTVLSYRHLAASKLLIAVWTAVNVGCLLFFGFVHQGGVVPCLLRLRSALNVDACEPARVVFSHTYMPPRHLLAIPRACTNVRVVDLGGGPTTFPSEVLSNGTRTIVVMPATLRKSAERAVGTGVRWERLFRRFPHFSGDDPPKLGPVLESFRKDGVVTAVRSLADQLTLEVFEVAREDRGGTRRHV